KSNWVLKKVAAKNAHKYPNYLRGEVYAFFIRGLYCDGSRTPMYHIPSDSEKRIKQRDQELNTNLWGTYTGEAPATRDYFEKGDKCDPEIKKFWELYDTSSIDSPNCDDSSAPLPCKFYRSRFYGEVDTEYKIEFTDCNGLPKMVLYSGEGSFLELPSCSSDITSIVITDVTNSVTISPNTVETEEVCNTVRDGACNPCKDSECNKFLVRYGILNFRQDDTYHAIFIDCKGDEVRLDNFKTTETPICTVSLQQSEIRVYHTSTNTLVDDFSGGIVFLPEGKCELDDDCEYCLDEECDECTEYKGYFGYWESTLKYPDNPCVWGQRDATKPFYDPFGLSCENIRYHKFPENCRAPIHDQASCGEKEYAYILGVEFENIPDFKDKEGNKIEDIVGYEILVANREGQESIISKGLMYNMWEESLPDCTSSFYANYPFNDLNDDVFLGQKRIHAGATINPNDDDGFIPVPTEWHSQTKFQYISPDVSYIKNDSGQYLQVYSEENGHVEGSYGLVEDFPKVVFLNSIVDFLIGIISAVVGATGLIGGSGYQIFDLAQTILNSLKNTLPPVNYAIYYLAKGYYNKWNCFGVTPDNIRRKITNIQYLIPTKQYAGTTKINNFQRESGLYVELNEPLNDPYIEENSRFLMTQNDCKTYFSGCNLVDGKMPSVSSYYAGVKQYRPAQYGFPEDNTVRTISSILSANKTGFLLGGDIYVSKHKMVRKMPFFTKLPVGLPNGSMFETSPYFNVQRPRFWMDFDDNKTIFSAIKEVSIIGAILPFIRERNQYNLDLIGRMTNDGCYDSDTECVTRQYTGPGQLDVATFIQNAALNNDPYFLKHNGKFYAYAIGVVEYWSESKFVSEYRE
ncbi:MAG: hypothetical protein ACRCVT_12635, partial [Leadbetterella sp.]